MNSSTLILPPEMSAEAKQQAEANELLDEIEDMNFNYTYEAAVDQWSPINAYAYSTEYEHQKDDIQLFVTFADLKEGQTVLDLGCGAGWVASAARQIVGDQGRVVAVNCSESMLQHALAFTIKEGTSGQIEFYPANISNLSSIPILQPSQFFRGFDRILARRVLPTMPNKSEILRQWSTYLAPGGTIVTDINHPLRIVGAITFAKPSQAAEKRRTIEAIETWKKCRDYIHKIADEAELKVLRKGYQHRAFTNEWHLYREKAQSAWLMSGRSRNAEEMTSRFGENHKRETIRSIEKEHQDLGIKVYHHPVSMLTTLQPRI
ncbi:hypothetical protein MMC17_009441 [Xylographa soralifera]|nr:hypothetical protein [Xylographa soralifera]